MKIKKLQKWYNNYSHELIDQEIRTNNSGLCTV